MTLWDSGQSDTVLRDLASASLLGCLAILLRIVLDIIQLKSSDDGSLDSPTEGAQRSGDRKVLGVQLQRTTTELSRLRSGETYADYAGCPPYPESMIQKYSEVCLPSMRHLICQC